MSTINVRHAVAADPPGGADRMAQLLSPLGVPRHGKVFYRLSGDQLKQIAEG